MVKRLTDRVQVGDRVEIRLRPPLGWVPGHVVALAAPGVWVKTAVGDWFVTHPGRLRTKGEADAS